MIISSYHHHSRHIETQLGTARDRTGPHPRRHSSDIPAHVSRQAPEKRM
ncbi:protein DETOXIFICATION 48-like [Iris pallida]|uniref:Protein DETOXIFICATION 48-like n=1 Tax=Iris pallida TaxID=29817 RepID=A0AAX6F4J7_IRIPA|nr:protein DETOXIFICATION 48-like [Iris pallida]